MARGGAHQTAAAALGERPKPRQILGMIIAFGGLSLIGLTVGSNGVTVLGLALVLASAVAWAKACGFDSSQTTVPSFFAAATRAESVIRTPWWTS